MRICHKFAQAAKNGTFFAINEWTFCNKQTNVLVQAIKDANALKSFNCDLSPNSGFHWDTYVKYYMLGIRQFVLKDDISSLRDAKSKLRKYVTDSIIHAFAILSVNIFRDDRGPIIFAKQKNEKGISIVAFNVLYQLKRKHPINIKYAYSI